MTGKVAVLQIPLRSQRKGGILDLSKKDGGAL